MKMKTLNLDEGDAEVDNVVDDHYHHEYDDYDDDDHEHDDYDDDDDHEYDHNVVDDDYDTDDHDHDRMYLTLL